MNREFRPIVSWERLQAWCEANPVRGSGKRKLREGPGRRVEREAAGLRQLENSTVVRLVEDELEGNRS